MAATSAAFGFEQLRPGAQPGGAFSSPVIFKTLHSNFDICRNTQIIKLKYCILINVKKVLFYFFLSYWLVAVSPYKVYLETGDLIENFVNDGI